MSLANTLRARSVARIKRCGAVEHLDDAIAVEEPLEIRVNGRAVAVVMRTPGHDRELAAGFLVSEGVVRTRDDVLDVVRCGERSAGSLPAREEHGQADRATGGENGINVLLAPGVAFDAARLTRHVFTSSSCGICSKATIAAVRAEFPPLASRLSPAREIMAALPAKLRAAQREFSASGGTHACGLFTAEGDLLAAREDVGRHNAFDKIVGRAFLADELPLAGRIALVSGRVSFELVQKALAAGIPCVAAISAPTTAAVELARAAELTLVGFLREGQMNVYAGTLAG